MARSRRKRSKKKKRARSSSDSSSEPSSEERSHHKSHRKSRKYSSSSSSSSSSSEEYSSSEEEKVSEESLVEEKGTSEEEESLVEDSNAQSEEEESEIESPPSASSSRRGTARQRGSPVEELFTSLPITSTKPPLSRAAQLEKEEKQKQRRLSKQRAMEETKAATIEKLLKAQTTKKLTDAKQGSELARFGVQPGQLAIRYIQTAQGAVVGIPQGIRFRLLEKDIPGSPVVTGKRKGKQQCAGPGCTQKGRYRCSKSLLPVCSLSCYQAIRKGKFL